MKRLVAFVLGFAAASALLVGEDTDGKRWWSYVEALANDQMQGRNSGSLEHRKAAEYVASQSNVRDSALRASRVISSL